MQYEQARLDRVEELGLGLVKSGYSFLDIMGTIFFRGCKPLSMPDKKLELEVIKLIESAHVHCRWRLSANADS